MPLTPTRKLKAASNLSDVASVSTSRTNLAAAGLAANTFTGLQEFSGTNHAGIKLISLTTAQRDALTAANGMLIYNSTTATVQKYDGGAWATLASSGAPLAHAASHQNGGSDEVATATPTANAIPKAGAAGTLAAGWLPANGGLRLYDDNPVSETTPVANGDNAIAIGSGATTGYADSVSIGTSAAANGIGAVALGKQTAGLAYSLSTGYRSLSNYGEHGHASGYFTFVGDSQTTVGVCRNISTNGALTQLLKDGALGLYPPYSMLGNGSITFKILVTACRTDAPGETDGWEFTGMASEDTGSASFVIDAIQENHIGATAWTCALSADTANGAIKIGVTGEVGKTIRWVARVEVVNTVF